MMIPSRRKLGAAALIIAGIGAFLVPFLLHSPTPQGTSNNNNNGSHTTTTTTNPTNPTTTTTGNNGGNNNNSGGPGGTTDTSGGSTSGTGTCADENSSHSDASDKTDKATTGDSIDLSTSHGAKSDPSDNAKSNAGHAYGLLKHQMDTTVALVKSMGTHNSAFHSHHDTKTDNKTVHTEQASSENSNDHDSSCAEKEETNDD